MNYVISEEELKSLAMMNMVNIPNATAQVKKFIKGRQPVELVAEGKMIIPFESEGFLIDGEFIGEIFHDKFGDKSVSNIKIFIQKEGKK